MSLEILLPTAPVAATAVNPETLIMYGLPKCGKTRAIMDPVHGLKNCLVLDVERGSNHYSGLKMQPEKDWGPVKIFGWLKEVASAIKKAGRPYDYVVVETLSFLDELSEWVGSWLYMNSPQGKKFNRNADGTMKRPSDPEYQSVHTLADGAGYRWSREAMTDLFDILKDCAKVCVIFTCHVSDKYVVSKETNQEVREIDISLTGKLKRIICRDVDAIGYIWNDDGRIMISFKGSEGRTGGMRGASHIQGYEGPLDWNTIFIHS